VLYSNFVQMARNQGAGVALIGASGNGKSNLMMLLFFQDSESGARTVAIDPKGDIAQFCYYLAFGSQMVHPQFAADANAGILGTPKSQFQPTNPQFWADTSIVDVTKAADGSLDPFNISDDVQLGKERALTALQTLIEPADWEKIRSVVNEALVAAMAPYYRIAAATEERIEARYEAMAHPDLAALNAEKVHAVRGLAERPNLWKVRNQIKEMAATYTSAGHVGDDAAAWRLAASKMDEIAGDGKSKQRHAPGSVDVQPRADAGFGHRPPAPHRLHHLRCENTVRNIRAGKLATAGTRRCRDHVPDHSRVLRHPRQRRQAPESCLRR